MQTDGLWEAGGYSRRGVANKADFYYVFIRNKPDFAVARATHDPDLEKRLRAGGRIGDWHPRQYELEEGSVIDYLPNSDAFRMCSDRLRDVLESERSEADVLQWLQAVVSDPRDGDLTYWILHFPQVPDVINRARSVFSGPDRLIKAVLDAQLVAGHRVLSRPHDSVSLIIADTVRRAIIAARCGGMEFSRVPIA